MSSRVFDTTSETGIMTTMQPQPFSQQTTDSQPATANLRPEMRLLLCCLHVHPTPETTQQIYNLLQQPIDWELLLDLAGWHGAMPQPIKSGLVSILH